MSEYILYILATALTSVFSYVIVEIKNAIKRGVNAKIKREAVSACVAYIEQKFRNSEHTSYNKFCTAQQQATMWLDSEGIGIGGVELECLIESEVYKLREGNRGIKDENN